MSSSAQGAGQGVGNRSTKVITTSDNKKTEKPVYLMKNRHGLQNEITKVRPFVFSIINKRNLRQHRLRPQFKRYDNKMWCKV